MENNPRLTKIVLYQHLGFLIIIVICFLNELLKLPSLIFSDHPFSFIFRRSTLEMLLILAVWLLVSTSTRRLLKHVRHVESFMRVCAWCRRVDYKGKWISLEEFLRRGLDTRTTHGICPECRARLGPSIEQAKDWQKGDAAA